MSAKIFLSTVSDEFRPYRDQLRADLARHNVEVKVQEDFKNLGGDTLDKLDIYIAHCDAVVHLIGDMSGSEPGAREQSALLAKYPDLADQLPPLGEALKNRVGISYTQWEAWLALYHGKLLLTAKAEETALRGPAYAPTAASRGAQIQHLARLEAVRRYPGCAFTSPADLAKHIAYTAILDLLVKDYAEDSARPREVAEGFIREMAARVAGDRSLDFDGMKQAVRNAIDIYERQIAGGQTQTNIDAIVDEALGRAQALVDKGKFWLTAGVMAVVALAIIAAITLRVETRRGEVEASHHAEIIEGQKQIQKQGMDGQEELKRLVIDAAGGGAPALRAINEIRGLLRPGNPEIDLIAAEQLPSLVKRILEDLQKPTAIARDFSSAVKHALEEAQARATQFNFVDAAKVLDLALAQTEIEDQERSRGRAALLAERGRIARLQLRYREAAEFYSKAAQTIAFDEDAAQNYSQDAASAFFAQGHEFGDNSALVEAIKIYKATLLSNTRARVPLDWAMTQMNLGAALQTLGERESGTARLEEAVAAYRAALQERTRERVPSQWAATQNNLGIALQTLGERESGTARLEEAVSAYRAALEERTRERVPLDWAWTQNNLGNALMTLGSRESGTARLEEAVSAYRAALEERTRDRVPLDWAMSLGNQGVAIMRLADRNKDVAMAKTAFEQITTAYNTMQSGGPVPFVDYYKAQLSEARALLYRLSAH